MAGHYVKVLKLKHKNLIIDCYLDQMLSIGLPEDFWFQTLHLFACNIRRVANKEITARGQLVR